MAKFLAFTAANLFAAGEEVMAYFSACRFTRSKRGDGTFVDDRDAFVSSASIKPFGIVFERGGMILPGVMPEDVKRIVGQEMPRLRYADRIALHAQAKAEAEKHGMSVRPESPESLIRSPLWLGIEVLQDGKQIGLVVIEADIPRIVQMKDGADDNLRIFKAMSDMQDGIVPTPQQRPCFVDLRLFPGDDEFAAGTWWYFPSGGILKDWEYEAVKRRLPNLGAKSA